MRAVLAATAVLCRSPAAWTASCEIIPHFAAAGATAWRPQLELQKGPLPEACATREAESTIGPYARVKTWFGT